MILLSVFNAKWWCNFCNFQRRNFSAESFGRVVTSHRKLQYSSRRQSFVRSLLTIASHASGPFGTFASLPNNKGKFCERLTCVLPFPCIFLRLNILELNMTEEKSKFLSNLNFEISINVNLYKFSDVCFKCNEEITLFRSGCQAMGNFYHVLCFTCTSCGKNSLA